MTILVFLSSIAYSKADTDSSGVWLTKRVAIEVAKDLERKDELEEINLLNEEKMDNMARQLGIQDRIIDGQQKQIENLEEINTASEEISATKDKEIKHWKKQYKKQKRQKFLVGGIGIGLLVLAVIAN